MGGGSLVKDEEGQRGPQSGGHVGRDTAFTPKNPSHLFSGLEAPGLTEVSQLCSVTRSCINVSLRLGAFKDFFCESIDSP